MFTYPSRLTEGLQFSLKSFVKKYWQRWDDENKKFIKSDVWQQGLKPLYIFNLSDGKQLELSRDQLQQCLITAFDSTKHWKDCFFEAKSNGKEKLEKRWFVNLVKGSTSPQSEKPSNAPQNANSSPTDDKFLTTDPEEALPF